MAAPTLVQSNAGEVITATSGVITLTGCTAGNVVIFQVLNDGANSFLVPDTLVNVVDLAGGSTALTHMNSPNNNVSLSDVVVVAIGRIYIGRVVADGTVSVNTRQSGGDDVYAQIHEFTNVNTGSTLADVLENGTAGIGVDFDTTGLTPGTTVFAPDVTTLGADRLACAFIFINDDNAPASFTTETGGDWTLVANFGSTTGTDGEVGLQTAPMASAGTISGGSYSQANDAWEVRGFALIGTTVGGGPAYQPRSGAVNFVDPGVL